ncbi:MAG: HD domain-containing protein [Halobacteria archaeon]
MTAEEILREVRNDEEVQAYLEAQNVNAVERLQYNDHGAKHVSIVRERALEMMDLLDGYVDWGVGDHDNAFGYEEAKVVVGLAATLHDIGHVVHRDGHVEYSVQIAAEVVDRLLSPHYDVDGRVALKGEVLHAILCHHVEEDPLTPEAGIVRVADALDMESGRSRLPYTKGERSIDTVSSQSVKRVRVTDGSEEYDVPVLVKIELVNSAGVYQIDHLLKRKLKGSGIEQYFKIVAVNEGQDDIVGKIEF